MKLKLDDISVFVSNFNDKATNIKKISEILNLGLDSFVFIDDNKIECELVKKKIPEITVVNMDTDPSNFVERIESLLPFYFKNITKEDIKRISSYKKIELINSDRKESKNLDEFLKNLKPRLTFEKINKSNCERSSQLIAKTNQFKFNANLFSPKNLLLKKDKCQPISFEDKYQNYGVIGVLVYDVNKKDKSLIIENWVLSCRVFSRRIENFILDFLKKKAQKLKCSKISFQFDITKKNLYLQNFLKEIGLKINRNKNQYFLNLIDLKKNKKSYIILK